MKELWPEAYLPKGKRTAFIGTMAVGIVGALAFAVALHLWSWAVAASGFCLMVASGFVVARVYLKPERSWYDNVLWMLLLILPALKLYRNMLGPKAVPEAGLVGLGVFVVWTLLQARIAWFLWHADGPDASGDTPTGSISA